MKAIFYKNGYPGNYFDKLTNEYLQKQKTLKEQIGNTYEENQTENTENRGNEYYKRPYLKVPFIGKASILYAKRIQKLIKKEKNKETRVGYETTKIQDSFQLKDKNPTEIRSKVVYQFTCPGDQDVQYIGFTKRSLRERYLEHKKQDSAIRDHADKCEYCNKKGISLDDFKVIKHCRTRTEAMINEAMLIKKRNPSLNRQLLKPGQTHTLIIFN